MLEFKGLSFEEKFPDPGETWFCGLSFEHHINNVSYWQGLSFEELLKLETTNALFMFGGI